MLPLYPGKTGQIVRPRNEDYPGYLKAMGQKIPGFKWEDLYTVCQLQDASLLPGDNWQVVRLTGIRLHWFESCVFTVLAEPPDEQYYINQMESYETA